MAISGSAGAVPQPVRLPRTDRSQLWLVPVATLWMSLPQQLTRARSGVTRMLGKSRRPMGLSAVSADWLLQHERRSWRE
jgi:hypothetical protein